MPEKVSFYYLKSPQADGKLRLACKLVSTAYNHGHKVFVSIPSENYCKVFNDRLWTFSWSSFIPHTLLVRNRQIDLDRYPVVIGHIKPPEWYNDVLVSLHDDAPQFLNNLTLSSNRWMQVNLTST